VSHQSGRDVDAGYYYTDASKWYSRAHKKNLDCARTWTFIRALITKTDVQAIFMDRSIQHLLKQYALSIGENPAWLDSLFGGPLSSDRAIIRHISGHKTHVHIRFYNPIAQRTGLRVYKMLLAHHKIEPPTYYIKVKVRRGWTLSKLARRYKTTVRALKRANRLRSTRIYAGRRYKVPRKGGVASVGELVIPPRRLPPTKSAHASR
jgi:penicillin-insensitive murein endopeptidase